MSERLTDGERETVCICAETSCDDERVTSDEWVQNTCDAHRDAVEAILAKRLAPIEALAEQWERSSHRAWVDVLGEDLRDALGAGDAARATQSPADGTGDSE